MYKSLTPTLSILAALGLFFFFISPRMDAVNALEMQIDTYESTIEHYNTFNQKVQTLLSAKESISATDRERLDRMLPVRADGTRTLVDLETMAKSNGLFFGNVVADKPEPILLPETAAEFLGAEDQGKLMLMRNPISFEVIGTYDQFKRFLAQLESSLELMEITDLSLTSSTDNFQQFSITLQTYSWDTVDNI